MFERLARSAFPALEWADNLWHGLSNFSRPYINVRDQLVRYLGGPERSRCGVFPRPSCRRPESFAASLDGPGRYRDLGRKWGYQEVSTVPAGPYPEAIAEPTKCSGGMSSYNLMWIGFTSCTNRHR